MTQQLAGQPVGVVGVVYGGGTFFFLLQLILEMGDWNDEKPALWSVEWRRYTTNISISRLRSGWGGNKHKMI